jgi:hypothetical protein
MGLSKYLAGRSRDFQSREWNSRLQMKRAQFLGQVLWQLGH